MSDNLLMKPDSAVVVEGALNGMPQPIDLNEVRELIGTVEPSKSMTQVSEKDHVVSGKRFGSFWDFDTQGILIYQSFNYFVGQSQHHLTPMGPCIRPFRCVPGVSPSERTGDNAYYQECIKHALSVRDGIDQHIKRNKYAVYHTKLADSDDWIVYRMGPAQNEPCNQTLISKIRAFHEFVVTKNGEKFNNSISKGKFRQIEKVKRGPQSLADIKAPALCLDDGTEYVDATVDASEDHPINYVPAIARDRMQEHMVIVMLPSPTLLNCVNESKYLKESMPDSPMGRNDYDEALLIRPLRAFRTPQEAGEFKENFAKHALHSASIHIISMNEMVPLLPLYTEQIKRIVPTTYRKETVQVAAVKMPEQKKIRRQLADATGAEMIHIGPEQTREEADAEMDKLRRVSRANERIIKTNEMFQSAAQPAAPAIGGGASKPE